MNAPVVEASNLVYTYPDGTDGLRGATFRVEPGEAVALVGPNGAGKSTLLLHLNGCLLPSSGAVRIGGVAIARDTAAAARRAVGLVVQDPDDQLFMPTVEDDVGFGPLNLGCAPAEVEARVAAALERVGMAHLRPRPPWRLSAGEKRAVAIAAVLAMAPPVLALDEPSSNLDPRSRRRLIETLRSLDMTRIVATHDLDLVVEVCPRAILLDGGRVIADGPASDLLYDEPLMLAHGLECPRLPRRRREG